MGCKHDKVSFRAGVLKFGESYYNVEAMIDWLKTNRTDGKSSAVLPWLAGTSPSPERRSHFVKAGTNPQLLTEPTDHFFPRKHNDKQCKQHQMLLACQLPKGSTPGEKAKRLKLVNTNFQVPPGYQI